MEQRNVNKNWYNWKTDMKYIFEMERILVLLNIVDKDGLFG